MTMFPKLGKCPPGVICSPRHYSACNTYTGVGHSDLNIPGFHEDDNLSLDYVIDTFGISLTEYMANNKVTSPQLGIVNLDPGPATAVLAEKINALNTKDITNSADLSCLGIAPSIYADALKDLKVSFALNPNANGAHYSYDFSNGIAGLPPDYQVISQETVVYQQNSVGGYTTIMAGAGASGGIQLENQNFPATVEHRAQIATPGGPLNIRKMVGLSSPVAKASGSEGFEVYGFVSTNVVKPTQDEVNKILALEVCALKSKQAKLQEFSFTGCEDLSYAGKGIEAVVTAHDGAICGIKQELKEPGKFKVKDITCDISCAEKYTDSTLQAVLDAMKLQLCAHERTINMLSARLSVLQQTVSICCKGAGLGASTESTTSSLSGGGSSSGGGGSSSGGGGSSSGGGGSTGGGGGSTGDGGNGGGGEDPGTGDPGVPQAETGYSCVPKGNGEYECKKTGIGNKTLVQCQLFCNLFRCNQEAGTKSCVRAFEDTGGPYYTSLTACEQGGCVDNNPCKDLHLNSTIEYDCSNKKIIVNKHTLDTYDKYNGRLVAILDNPAHNYHRELEQTFSPSDPVPDKLVWTIPEDTIGDGNVEVYVVLDLGCQSNSVTKKIVC